MNQLFGLQSVFNNRWYLIVIVLIGASFRLYGIDVGLPYLYDPDEPDFVERALSMLNHRDLNPHWFGHPGTTTMYLLAGIYVVMYGVGTVMGIFTSPEDFKALYWEDPTAIYLIGRILSTLFDLGTIILVYLIARRLFNSLTGLLTALIIALSPVHIYYSQLVRTDNMMTFLILVSFWFCLDILEKRKWSSYIFAGFFLGLAVATKYPAVVMCLVIALSHILSSPSKAYKISRLSLAAVASLGGAFIGSPYLFLDFSTVLTDVIREARPTHLGHTSFGVFETLVWYAKGPFIKALSFIGFLLSVIGLVLSVVSKEKGKWILVSFPLLFLLFISNLNLRWERWALPIIPFLAICAASTIICSFYWLVKRNSWLTAVVVSSVLLIAIGAPLMEKNILEASLRTKPETRTLAKDWMVKNIPEGSRVVLELLTPQLPLERYRLYQVSWSGKLVEADYENIKTSFFVPHGWMGRLKDIREIVNEKIDYMVLCEHYYQEYDARKELVPKYRRIAETYESLMSMGKLIHTIKRPPRENQGPTILIYQFRSSDLK